MPAEVSGPSGAAGCEAAGYRRRRETGQRGRAAAGRRHVQAGDDETRREAGEVGRKAVVMARVFPWVFGIWVLAHGVILVAQVVAWVR